MSSRERKWYDKPQVCSECGKSFLDPDITAEMMEAASTPYGYIKCPVHFPSDPPDAPTFNANTQNALDDPYSGDNPDHCGDTHDSVPRGDPYWDADD